MKYWLPTLASLIYAFSLVSRVFAATPTISIVSPSPNQTIAGNTVNIVVSVPNINLVDFRTYPKINPAQGHLHLWLDQTDYSKASAIKSPSPSYAFENVKPGRHTLVAELVKNDHSSYSPPIQTQVTFTTTLPISSQNTSSPTPNVLLLAAITVVLLCATVYLVDQVKSPKKKAKSKKKSR